MNKPENKDIVYNGIFLLLGSNLDDRKSMLEAAKASISENKIKIIAESAQYETEAWGKTDQPPFLNQVIHVETNLKPLDLLTVILEIEKTLGRQRLEKWGPRIIDIDMLYYNQEICIYENLKVPHPEIHNRRFTLEPLVEIAASFRHPVFNVSNAILLERCSDSLEVTKLIG